MSDANDKPKIIIDDDWKTQAQAEKEKLAQQTVKAPEGQPSPESAAAGGVGSGSREIPPASFSSLVSTLAAQTIMALGGYEDPQSGRRYVDLDLAKHHIDTLSVLEDKCKGNLSEDESKLLNQAMYETRLAYVQIAQQATRVPLDPGQGQ